MRRFLAVYAAAVYLFLYVPLAVLGVFSFNSSKIADLAWIHMGLVRPRLS